MSQRHCVAFVIDCADMRRVGTIVRGVSRRMARTDRSLVGPRSHCCSADQSSIGPSTRNSMFALRFCLPRASARPVSAGRRTRTFPCC